MSGIDRIYEKIISEAKEQAESALYEASQKKDFMRGLVDESLNNKRKEQIDLAEKEAENIIKRAVSNRNLEGKKQLLSVKQQVISEIFDRAHKALVDMADAKLIIFYGSLIKKSLVEGDNEIILNKQDKEGFGKDLIASLEKDLEKNTKVFLAEQTIPDDKGVIVKNGNIYANSTFTSILKYKKQELENDIMNITFERSVQA